MNSISCDTALLATMQSPAPAALTTPPAATPTAPATSPSASALIIANLQGSDVSVVEAALVSVREACRRGDNSAIEAALIEQAALLQALGVKLMKVAGKEDLLARVQVFTNLSLRSMDGARKSLGMLLAGKQAAPKNQTNVQVNVGNGPHANEILEVPCE